MDQPLWQPSRARVAQANMTRVRAAGRRRAWRRAAATTPGSGRGRSSIPSCSGRRCGASPTCARAGRGTRCWSTATACRAPGGSSAPSSTSPRTCCGTATSAPRSSPGPRTGGGAQLSYRELYERVARPGRGAAARRRRPGRSGRGGHAARPGNHHRDAGDHRARRDLVVVLARLRRPGRARPLRPDRAQGADHHRRLPLQRQDDRRARQAGRDRRPPAEPASASSWCRSSMPRARAGAADRRRPLPRVRGGGAGAARVRAAAVRSPDLHPVLVRHDRACPRRSCTAPAAPCSSTRRSCCCTPTSSPRTGSSTSRPAAG